MIEREWWFSLQLLVHMVTPELHLRSSYKFYRKGFKTFSNYQILVVISFGSGWKLHHWESHCARCFPLAPADLLSTCLYFFLCHAFTWVSLTTGFQLEGSVGYWKVEEKIVGVFISSVSSCQAEDCSNCVILLRPRLLLGKPSTRVLVLPFSPHSGPGVVIASCFC